MLIRCWRRLRRDPCSSKRKWRLYWETSQKFPKHRYRDKLKTLEGNWRCNKLVLDRELMGNCLHHARQQWLIEDAQLKEKFYYANYDESKLNLHKEMNKIIKATILIWYAIFCLSIWYFNWGRNFSTALHCFISSGHFLANSRKQTNERRFVESKIKFTTFPNSNCDLYIQITSITNIQVKAMMQAMHSINRIENFRNLSPFGVLSRIPLTGITPKHCANARMKLTASWKVPSYKKSSLVPRSGNLNLTDRKNCFNRISLDLHLNSLGRKRYFLISDRKS